jgi:hypothetical protein
MEDAGVKFPPPNLRADTRRNLYELAEDYACPLPGHSCVLQVSKGQRTDGASIPRPFWVVIGHPFTPDYIAAAFVHDCLYCAHLFTRRQTDEIFRRILLATASKSRARVMWLAVRAFGWLAWRKHPSSIAAARERIDVTTYPPRLTANIAPPTFASVKEVSNASSSSQQVPKGIGCSESGDAPFSSRQPFCHMDCENFVCADTGRCHNLEGCPKLADAAFAKWKAAHDAKTAAYIAANPTPPERPA